MDFLLVDHKNAMVYLDDIVVYSKNEREHEQHLRQLFEILRTADVQTNLVNVQLEKLK